MSRQDDRLEQTQAALDQVPGWEVAVARLAKLPPIEYDRCREAEAQALDCRAATLDAEVKKARGDGASEGQGKPLEFPAVESWPQPVDGAELLTDLVAVIRRYVVLSEPEALAVALWAVMTWLTDDLDCLPILRVLSPTKGCGKTTLLDVVGELVCRPLPVSGISSAALFRVIEQAGPTLLLDEADTFLKESEDHRQILNAGHTRTAAQVIRTVGEDHEPRCFNVFGPKLLAGIGDLAGTIEDRAVRIILRKKAPGESIGSLRRDGREQFVILRQRVCRWATDHRRAVGDLARRVPVPEVLPDRAADNWSPLLAIADTAAGDWQAHARDAAVKLTRPDDLAELPVLLLGDICDLFDREGKDRLASQTICDELAKLEERPWGELNRGKPITPRQLARYIRGFGVVSGTIRLDGGSTAKGYYRTALEDPFARYLQKRHADPAQRHNAGKIEHSGAPLASHGDSCDGYKRHTLNPVTFGNSLKPMEMQVGDVVTDAKTETAFGGAKLVRVTI